MKKPIRLISVSDIHLGNRLVPAPIIADNFRRYVFPYIAKCDILVIGGDLTDTAIGWDDTHANAILAFYFDLLAWCSHYDVTVFLLRGTFSHDRKQLSMLPLMHEKHKFKNELAYFDKVSLHTHKRSGTRFVFLPDDLPYGSSDEVLDVVAQQMRAASWDYVDYVCAHGFFDHVLPPVAHGHQRIVYRRSQFPFVRRYILVGHEHTASMVDRVIYNGSFDRLTHNDETTKGFNYIEDDGKDATIQFVENKDATTFRTLDLSGISDATAVLDQYVHVASALTDTHRTHHLRILHPSRDVISAVVSLTAKDYPHIRLTHKLVTVLDEHKKEKRVTRLVLDPPTPENLPKMVSEYILRTKGTLTLTEEQIRKRLLELTES